MKLHPREIITLKADREYREFVTSLIIKHDLTHGEQLRIMSTTVGSLAEWIIRLERHPDNPDQPGGLGLGEPIPEREED